MTRELSDDLSNRSQPSRDTAPERPDVIVEFLFEQGLLFIAVRNIGARPAIDVSVRFDETIIGLGGSRDVGAQALFHGIAFLGPAREIATLLDSSASYFAHRQPTIVTAHVEYRDTAGARYAQTIRHDLEIYRDLVFTVGGRPERAPCRASDRKRNRT